ncbi:hypothetical protein [Alteromonas facilis]|uniref:hypothetical protein n=1 Tax=Alteromonas facilis TaxID=2048004 RepID=UPI000C29543A|nr:hypothetical protein [Alteromonas facilis]
MLHSTGKSGLASTTLLVSALFLFNSLLSFSAFSNDLSERYMQGDVISKDKAVDLMRDLVSQCSDSVNEAVCLRTCKHAIGAFSNRFDEMLANPRPLTREQLADDTMYCTGLFQNAQVQPESFLALIQLQEAIKQGEAIAPTQEKGNKKSSSSGLAKTSTASLAIESFPTEGLFHKSEFAALYLGDEESVDLRGEASPILTSMVETYIKKYSNTCYDHLPDNAIQIESQMCVENREYKINGVQVGPTYCNRTESGGTGIFTTPRMLEAFNTVKRNSAMAPKSNSVEDVFRSISGRAKIGNTPMHVALTESLVSFANMEQDMNVLFSGLACDAPSLQLFEDNLYAYVVGNKLKQHHKLKTLSEARAFEQVTYKPHELDIKTLMDDVISDHSIGWLFNRYVKGSINNLNASTGNDGNVYRVTADFKTSSSFNQVGISQGTAENSAMLMLNSEGLGCIRLQDNFDRCGLISRKVITDFEEGLYKLEAEDPNKGSNSINHEIGAITVCNESNEEIRVSLLSNIPNRLKYIRNKSIKSGNCEVVNKTSTGDWAMMRLELQRNGQWSTPNFRKPGLKWPNVIGPMLEEMCVSQDASQLDRCNNGTISEGIFNFRIKYSSEDYVSILIDENEIRTQSANFSSQSAFEL